MSNFENAKVLVKQGWLQGYVDGNVKVFKGIPYDALKAAAVEVAVVRAVPYLYEMYDTDFVKQGYDVRQIVPVEV